MNKIALLAILILSVSFASAKSPRHISLRAESMGGAHVAVVDDKDAIHFNYAGLSQINRLGNYDKRPEQGYYPRNWIGDMRLTFLVPLDPFIVIDVALFALAEFAAMNDPAPLTFLDGNHNMQTLMINDSRDCI